VGSRSAVDRHDRLLFGERCGNLPHQVTFGLLALGESPRGHVTLHHGTFFQLVPDEVHMVWAGSFRKHLEVISRLSPLVLEVVFSDGNELLIGIINLLLIVALVTAGSDYDLLGSPLWSPLVAFSTPLCARASCLEWHPSTATGGAFLSPWTKTALTASSPKACLVVMSSSSFVVFGKMLD
jgi:hypothetical protein